MPDDIKSGSMESPQSGDSERRHTEPRPKKRRRSRKPHYYGAIDLGTNNCRLLIARAHHNGFQVVDSYSNVVRLGKGLSSTGRLSDESMDAAVEALGVCAGKMKAKSVKRWRALATQACRQADNGAEFLERVKKETGLTLEVISPRVEARLSVMGVTNIIDRNMDVALVIDIGGGSTELSWVDIRRLNEEGGKARLHRPPISAWASLPIGVVSLSEKFPEDHENNAAWYESMKDHVRAQLIEQRCEKRFANVFQEGRGHLVGTSGTITSLASVHLGLPYYRRDKIDGIWINSKDTVATAKRLAAMPLAERQKQPCIGEDRATMLTAGCAIVEVLCEHWPSEKIRVADRGLREGMLMGLMNKSQIRTGPKPQKNDKADSNE